MPDATDSGWGLLNSSSTGVVWGFVSTGWIFSVLKEMDLLMESNDHIASKLENPSVVVIVSLIVSN